MGISQLLNLFLVNVFCLFLTPFILPRDIYLAQTIMLYTYYAKSFINALIIMEPLALSNQSDWQGRDFFPNISVKDK